MATGLPGGTSFMEDYTYDLDPDGPKVLGAHMLEVCPTIAAAQPSCEIHPLSIGGKADPVRLVFDTAPGPALVAGMTDMGGRFRIVANVIDIVEGDEPLPRLPVARAIWRPRPDYRTAVEGWLRAGGAHHTVLTRALGPEPLIDLAEMVGVELLLIDEGSTLPALHRELRWNEAYYHLARGL
jgi:L-arabinose isomerase